MDKIHKNKIEEIERDRSNRLEEAKIIIEKKLKEEEKSRRLKEERERKQRAEEARKIQIKEVETSKEIERENLKKMEERRLGLPLEQENSEQEKKDQS